MKNRLWKELEDIYTTAITYNDKQNKQIQILQERIEQLEKENAELKDDNKVMADNYSNMERWFYNNLSKAKEIIKLLLVNKPDTYSGTDVMSNQKKMFNFSNAVDEAMEYLKEEINENEI